MRDNGVVRGSDGLATVRDARRVMADAVPQPRHDPWLVDRREVGDPIAEVFSDSVRVISERSENAAVWPAACILQGLWKVPVIQGQCWFDSGLEQGIDEPVIKGEATRFASFIARREQP